MAINHMDYIIRTAASKGIYIGMVCIWGSPVDAGLMNEKRSGGLWRISCEPL